MGKDMEKRKRKGLKRNRMEQKSWEKKELVNQKRREIKLISPGDF